MLYFYINMCFSITYYKANFIQNYLYSTIDLHPIIINLITYILLLFQNKIITLYTIIILYYYKLIVFYVLLDYCNYNITYSLNISIILGYLNSNYTVYVLSVLIYYYFINSYYIFIIAFIYKIDYNFLSYTMFNNIYNLINYNILLDNIYFYLHPVLLYITVIYILYYTNMYIYGIIFCSNQCKYSNYNYNIILFKLLSYSSVTLMLGSIWAFIENTWGGFWVWDYSECINFNLLMLALIWIHTFTTVKLWCFYYIYIYIYIYNIYIYIYIKYFMLDSSHMFSQLLYWYYTTNWIFLFVFLLIIMYKYITIYNIYTYYINILLYLWIIYYLFYFYDDNILYNILLFSIYNFLTLYLYVTIFIIYYKYIWIIIFFNWYWLYIYSIIIYNIINKKFIITILHFSILSLIYSSYLSSKTYINVPCTFIYYNWINVSQFYNNIILYNLLYIAQLKTFVNIYNDRLLISLYNNIIYIVDILYFIKINVTQCNNIIIKLNNNWISLVNTNLYIMIDSVNEILYSYLIIILTYIFFIK